jgi:hypothetical protein
LPETLIFPGWSLRSGEALQEESGFQQGRGEEKRLDTRKNRGR